MDIIMQEDLNYVLPYVELLLRYRAALSPSHLASLSKKKELNQDKVLDHFPLLASLLKDMARNDSLQLSLTYFHDSWKSSSEA